ncbi:hypothetical protein G4H71_05085 [Rhodococcus triatomae]|uniref:Uncharacterized protein n=1 Tax=Rhodococcus triatomae TaxID=300028 RepID=A0A1G8A7A8_9NOCA|nr:hypothetical protein [Rhodococcus triatomae]QNG17841.1 hypothetical protein G4H72_02960 [Rhodococcus triatomae]QNG22491.1 hypothetical protein G4H71_05085 [Rhodococcus triatomae]SDH16834.1 hypothetical protein SAMN05444695_101342 [Rhodococcus triatomae]
MVAWIIALAVWTAAGARVGRVAAREATPLRSAMAVAAVAVAVSVTVLLPPVWDLLAELGSSTASPESAAPATVFDLAWLLAAAASSAGAISVWSIISRRGMRVVTTVVYTLAALCGVLAVGGVESPASVFQIVAFAVVVGTGLRYVEWSPLGRGITLIVTGSAIVLVTEAIGLFTAVPVRPATRLSDLVPHAAAAVAIAFGCVWVLGETWVRSRLYLRRTRALHAVLVERFPEVVDENGRAHTTVLAAADVVAHVMDALYIQAGAGMFEAGGGHAPVAAVERADFLAPWIDDPLQSPMLGTDLVMPPDGMSAMRWVGILADAYRRYAADAPEVTETRPEELPGALR